LATAKLIHNEVPRAIAMIGLTPNLTSGQLDEALHYLTTVRGEKRLEALVSVRRQFDSVESVVIHSALPDSMEAPDVDERKSGAVSPQPIAVSERFDGCRVGSCGAGDPAGQTRWQPTPY